MKTTCGYMRHARAHLRVAPGACAPLCAAAADCLHPTPRRAGRSAVCAPSLGIKWLRTLMRTTRQYTLANMASASLQLQHDKRRCSRCAKIKKLQRFCSTVASSCWLIRHIYGALDAMWRSQAAWRDALGSLKQVSCGGWPWTCIMRTDMEIMCVACTAAAADLDLTGALLFGAGFGRSWTLGC